MKTHEKLTLGEFTLDPVAKVLFRGGAAVPLGRKAVETLLVLVENAGQVVTKEEIMRAVWGDRVVDEANLTQNIAVLRKTLAVQPGDPAQIETFSGRGYRIQGPVNAAALPRGRKPWWMIGGAAVVVAAAGVTLWPPARQAESSYTVAPLVRLPGREYQPAVSPDGTAFAFVFAPPGSGRPEIWVKRTGQGEPQRVGAGDAHFSSPAWSPDGRSLAYLRTTRSSTDVIVDARVIARLTPPTYGFEGRMLDWSPDGAHLAVSHAPSVERPAALFSVNVSSSEVARLSDPAGAAGDIEPRYSPDGRSLAFLRLTHRSRQELFVMDLKARATRQITQDGNQISSYDWSRDGRSLIYASNRTGEFRLWRAPLDGSARQSLGVAGEFPIHFSAARGADVAAYSRLHQDRNIWSFDLARKTWTRLIASTGQDASPQVSPSGDAVVFRSDRGGDEQLWVARADGSGAVQITRAPMHPSVGRWSPDGRAIAFNDPLSTEISIAWRTAGGAWGVKAAGMRGVHPVFSPDGQWLFAGGPSGISRWPAAGGEATELTATKSESLGISADGKFVYFVKEPFDTALQRLTIDSGQVTQVLDGLVPGCSSCWALAPEGIYFLASGKDAIDSQSLAYFDFKRGATRTIAPYPEPLWPNGSGPFSLSPDGRSLLCVRAEPTESDVMVMTSFR